MKKLLLASVLMGTSAFAQGTAVLTGIVTDASSGKPVPDVVVTATSTALQGEEVVVTDASGLYRLPQLPPGVFTLRLEKESFKPFSRSDISVRSDRTVKLNVQLLPEALKSEEVVVVGKPPTVDVGSTMTGVSVGKDFINNIAFVQPNASGVRSFESLMSVAPQAVSDFYGFGIAGTTSPENLIMVDGLSVNNTAFGTNGSQFPIEFVEEANVITGGYMAEYGRATGGVLSVETKRGGNEFHGSVWANWTPGALIGRSPEIKDVSSIVRGASDLIPSGTSTNRRLWNSGDFGAEIGGPILKDKLWFYVGFSPSFRRIQDKHWLSYFDGTFDTANTFTPNLDADGDPALLDIPGTTRYRFVDARAYSYIAKLTYLINSDQNVAISVTGSPSSEVVPFSFANRVSSPSTTDDSVDVSLKYSAGFMDKRLLVDAVVGWHHQTSSTLPSDGTKIGSTTGGAAAPEVIFRRTLPHTINEFESLTDEQLAFCRDPTGAISADLCPVTGGGATYTAGGMGYMESISMDRIQARVGVTYLQTLLGHHILKGGLDIERNGYDINKAYSGAVLFRESVGGGSFTDLRGFGYFEAPDQFKSLTSLRSVTSSVGVGAYLQDSWSVLDLVTANLGLRYENQLLYGGDGSVGMALTNMLSPRLGLIYDFTQQGRSKIFASYATYYESVPLDLADRALTGEVAGGFIHRRTGTPGCTLLENGEVRLDRIHNECEDPANSLVAFGPSSPNQKGIVTGQGKTPIDPNLIPQSTTEFVAGGEYEVFADARVGLQYTHRYLNGVIEDMSRDEASTYFVGNPGSGIASDFPKAVRDYDAVTVYFTKAFSDLWQTQFSYTYSSLRGNISGLFRPETTQLDPNINADFDLKSLLTNRTGPLDGDHNHVIKLFASKEFPISNSFGLLLGLTYQGTSGAPLNYLASHPLYGADEAFVLPRGSAGRLPWLHTVNAKLGASYKFSKENAVVITADIFNLLNFQAATDVDQSFSAADILPVAVPKGQNPQEYTCLAGNDPACTNKFVDSGGAEVTDFNKNFKHITRYQSPISVRFGVKVTF